MSDEPTYEYRVVDADGYYVTSFQVESNALDFAALQSTPHRELRFFVLHAGGPHWKRIGDLLAAHRDGRPVVWWHADRSFDEHGCLIGENSVALAIAHEAAKKLDRD